MTKEERDDLELLQALIVWFQSQEVAPCKAGHVCLDLLFSFILSAPKEVREDGVKALLAEVAVRSALILNTLTP